MTLTILTKAVAFVLKLFDWVKRTGGISVRFNGRHKLAIFLLISCIILFLYFLFMTEQAYWMNERIQRLCVDK